MLFIVFTCLLLNCCADKKEFTAASQHKFTTHVYLTNQGYHTGIVVGRDDLGRGLAFVRKHLGEYNYYEFGWGDERFYQASEVSSGLALRAILWPTASVMYVIAFSTRPQKYIEAGKFLEIPLSEKGLENLTAHLAQSFKHGKDGEPLPINEETSGRSQFYQATEKYHLAHTCNTWAAEILKSGGVPIDPAFTLTAKSLFRKTENALMAGEHGP